MTPSPITNDPALTSAEQFHTLVDSIQPTPAPVLSTPTAAAPTAGNPLFDALRSPIPFPVPSNITLTDNSGVTHFSSLSASLDLFSSLSSSSNGVDLRSQLTAAWAEDPLLTLKIIWNARSIPRGKGEKEAWTRAVAWLAEEHPKTLLKNLLELVEARDLIAKKKRKAEEQLTKEEGGVGAGAGEGEKPKELEMDVDAEEEEEEEREINPSTARSHGYFKDLLGLLVLSALSADNTRTGSELGVEGDFTILPGFIVQPDSPYARFRSKTHKPMDDDELPAKVSEEKASRIKPILDRVDQLLDPSSTNFHRALHLSVARIFGQQLKSDLASLETAQKLREEGKSDEARIVEGRISLAGKWAPSEGGFHDTYTRIASSIAIFLFPPSSSIESESTTSIPLQAVTRSLTLYRTQYLVPLRRHLDLVERKMSSNEWSSINYARVPSIAMDKNKGHFFKHDADGFTSYLAKVAEGKATISGASMTPAVLLKQAIEDGGSAPERVALQQVVQGQWNTLVESLTATSESDHPLSHAVAVCDVSGSMFSPKLYDGTGPIHSSVALSILISQITRPPFGHSIITFSSQPRLIDFESESTLAEKARRVMSEGVGYDTNFIAVFRLILSRAVAFKISQEDMIKKIFVFSDMEFNQAEAGGSNTQFATHYQIVKKEFETAGYEVPELVFWNLAWRGGAGVKGTPVKKGDEGTTLVGGYSAALLKVFLEGGELDGEEEEEVVVVDADGETKEVKIKRKMDPVDLMKKALAHESFDGLKVFD